MRLSILVVEREDMVLQTIRSMIEESGHIVFTATSQLRALGILNSIAVDIVVTSLALEGATDGLLLATKAKALQPKISVLLVSDIHENRRCHYSQVDGYIQKPFDCNDIARAIKLIYKSHV